MTDKRELTEEQKEMQAKMDGSKWDIPWEGTTHTRKHYRCMKLTGKNWKSLIVWLLQDIEEDDFHTQITRMMKYIQPSYYVVVLPSFKTLTNCIEVVTESPLKISGGSVKECGIWHT